MSVKEKDVTKLNDNAKIACEFPQGESEEEERSAFTSVQRSINDKEARSEDVVSDASLLHESS